MSLTRPARRRGAREDPPLDLLQQLSLGRNLGPVAQSRFRGHHPTPGAREPARPETRPPASTLRAQAALSRLAHFEGRLRGRRAPPSGPGTPTSAGSQARSASSSRAGSPTSLARGSSPEPTGRRFLKKRASFPEAASPAAPRRNARPSPAPPAPRGAPDSDEEDASELPEGLTEPAGEKVAPGTGLSERPCGWERGWGAAET